jgi:hypothetical protein
MSMKAARNARMPSADYRPNEFDRKRIERAIAGRRRYRYVSPSVHTVDGGYFIRSPCCSRNIDPNGGVVDVALIQYRTAPRPWLLHGKDHNTQQWLPYGAYNQLAELLAELSADPKRRFWQ